MNKLVLYTISLIFLTSFGYGASRNTPGESEQLESEVRFNPRSLDELFPQREEIGPINSSLGKKFLGKSFIELGSEEEGAGRMVLDVRAGGVSILLFPKWGGVEGFEPILSWGELQLGLYVEESELHVCEKVDGEWQLIAERFQYRSGGVSERSLVLTIAQNQGMGENCLVIALNGRQISKSYTKTLGQTLELFGGENIPILWGPASLVKGSVPALRRGIDADADELLAEIPSGFWKNRSERFGGGFSLGLEEGTLSYFEEAWMPSHTVNRRVWKNVYAANLDDAVSRTMNQVPADVSDFLPTLQSRAWTVPWTKEDLGDHYLEVVEGYLMPEESGYYVFSIIADDSAQLWLGSNEFEEDLKLVANVIVPQVQSRGFTFDEELQLPVWLEKGRPHYLRFIHFENLAADHFSVAWAKLGEAGLEEPFAEIPSRVLSSISSGVPGTMPRSGIVDVRSLLPDGSALPPLPFKKLKARFEDRAESFEELTYDSGIDRILADEAIGEGDFYDSATSSWVYRIHERMGWVYSNDVYWPWIWWNDEAIWVKYTEYTYGLGGQEFHRYDTLSTGEYFEVYDQTNWIVYRPHFVSHPSGGFKTYGESITLNASLLRSEPDMTKSWWDDSSPRETEASDTNTLMEYTDNYLITSDSGTYYAHAFSWAGTDQSNSVYVGVKPKAAISPSPSNYANGISVGSSLGWANGGGASSYKVYFGTDSTPDGGEYKGSFTSTTWNPPGNLSYSTTYYWRIDAVNADGTTTGTVWRFTTQGPPPSQATILDPANYSSGVSISSAVSWSNGGGATSYKVYFGTDSTPDSGEDQGTTTGTSWDPPGNLSYSTTYYWRIDAINATGTTPGTVWRFTTQGPPPSKATSPDPSHYSSGVTVGTNISWSNGGGATSYRVFFGTDYTPDGTEDKGIVTNPFWDPPGNLSYSTTYYWRIDAINATGTTPGTVWRFTTQAEPPQPPIVTSSSNANAVELQQFTYTITATNSPTSYRTTNLPSWLSRNGSQITGTAPIGSVGSLNFSVYASNAGGESAGKTVALTIGPADSTDLDADGLYDDWEEYFFGSIAYTNGLEDSDSDGYYNLFEFKRYSAPNNSGDTPSADSLNPTTIQSGLDSLNNDFGVIELASGTYTGAGNTNLVMDPNYSNYTIQSPSAGIQDANVAEGYKLSASEATGFIKTDSKLIAVSIPLP
jgi:hypothetical protein